MSKLLGVRRIVSVNIKIPSSSSGKPAHFLIFTASQMIIYLCFVALSSISSGFFVFLFDVSIKKKGINFSSKVNRLRIALLLLKKNKIKAYLERAEIGKLS